MSQNFDEGSILLYNMGWFKGEMQGVGDLDVSSVGPCLKLFSSF